MIRKISQYVRMAGEALQPYLLLVIRLYWGIQFATAGAHKWLNLENVASYFQTLGIPLPFANAFFAGTVELVGGLLLVAGLMTRIAALPLFFVLFVAFTTAEKTALVVLFRDRDPSLFLASPPFLYAFVVLVLFCFGPGRISVDYWLSGGHKNKQLP